MKKLILSAAIVAIAGLTTVNASEVKIANPVVSVQDSVIKTPIKMEELPAAVLTVLKSDPYKDWTPTAAFSVKDGQKEYFQIDVKKEEETASVKLDKDGKPVE